MIHLLSLCLSDAREFLMRHFRFRFGFFFESFKKELERRRKKKREKNKFQNSSHTKSSRAGRARFEKISTDKDEQGGKQMHAYSLK